MASPVKVLELFLYSPEGVALEPVRIPNPSWDEVERCIRALDQYCHPLVRLCLSDDETDNDNLDILGGNGKYAIFQTCAEWIFYDPNKGDDEVEVWLSDQGSRWPDSNVCNDIERVIRIAREFFRNGSYECLDHVE
jgi:hypothetical protein